jgi:hypothetical protein
MKTKLITIVLLAGSSLFAQGAWHEREEFRDVRNDQVRLERLRADIARDRFELRRAFQSGDRWAAARIEQDLVRDHREFEALRRDISYDRHEIWEDRFAHRDRFERGYR